MTEFEFKEIEKRISELDGKEKTDSQKKRTTRTKNKKTILWI